MPAQGVQRPHNRIHLYRDWGSMSWRSSSAPIAVIGSGTMAQNLSPGDTGLELLENAAATGAALVAIILAVGSVAGAHLNPVVSCADAFFGGLRRVELAVYIFAQVAGAIIGAYYGDSYSWNESAELTLKVVKGEM